jgi:hypothetical protein
MGTVQTLFGMTVVSLLAFLWIGAPIILTSWLRKRRQETVRRQIALTDAIDGQLGMIVAPVVKQPLWGPWQVQLAVPFTQPGAAARILAVAHDVLSALDGVSQTPYQVVLTPKPEPVRQAGEIRRNRCAERWAGDTAVAA